MPDWQYSVAACGRIRSEKEYPRSLFLVLFATGSFVLRQSVVNAHLVQQISKPGFRSRPSVTIPRAR